jgi:hypothetical protein
MIETPYGYCQCGCGKETKRSTKTDKTAKQVKGEPLKYLLGHSGCIGKTGEDSSRLKGGKTNTSVGYIMVRMVDHPKAHGGYVAEHILVVEAILGRFLTDEEEVHHDDENKANNKPLNLIVCSNRAHHMLLHRQRRTENAGYNKDWRKCPYCKQYDDPLSMAFAKQSRNFYHSECAREYAEDRRVLKRSQNGNA